MNQRTLILIVALAFILIGAGVWWYFNQEKVSDLFNPPANTNTTNTNTAPANTNTEPVNAALDTELKGTNELDQSVTVNNVPLHFSSASKLKTFSGATAPDNQEFVIVFFDALPGEQVLAAQQGLSTGTLLRHSDGSSQLDGVKVASDVVTGDRGYVRYAVPDDATNFELIFVEGGTRFDLPL